MNDPIARIQSVRDRSRDFEVECSVRVSGFRAEMADAIREAQASGLSLEAIGRALDPPVSRQRVFQMRQGIGVAS